MLKSETNWDTPKQENHQDQDCLAIARWENIWVSEAPITEAKEKSCRWKMCLLLTDLQIKTDILGGVCLEILSRLCLKKLIAVSKRKVARRRFLPN